MVDALKDRVRKVVGEAAEMVKGLPEALQGVAFTKAFDALIGPTVEGSSGAQQQRRRGASGNRGRGRHRPEGEGGNGITSEAVTTIMEKLDRTQHPQIGVGRRARDLALFVLRAARTECGVEWLTAGDISAVLRKKFNLPVDPPAVRMALKSARDYTNRKPEGQGYAYRLMAPGEEYLNTLIAETTDARGKSRPSKG